jgi:hypothetical protein
LLEVTMIGIGAMIGAGVFALTGFAAGLAGPALLIVFLLNGVIAAFTAMSYAELGPLFPKPAARTAGSPKHCRAPMVSTLGGPTGSLKRSPARSMR